MPVLKRTKLQLALAGLLSSAQRWVYRFGIDDFVEIQKYEWGTSEPWGVEFDFNKSSSPSSDMCIIGQRTTDNWFISLSTDGKVNVSNQIFSQTTVTDGIPHKIKVISDGNTISVYIDDRLDGTFTRNWTGYFDVIGRNVYGLYLSGEVYNVGFYGLDGLNRLYPLDDGWQSNPVVTEIISGLHGTAYNFNQDQWEKKSV